MKHTLSFLLLLTLVACGSPEPDVDLIDTTTDVDTPMMASAMAQISPTSADGAMVNGDVTFTEEADGLRLTATLSGLTPSTMHGFHLHRDGACGPGDDGTPGGAAGPHWDPLATENHDGPTTDFSGRHAGDLGNLSADAAGMATVDMLLDNLSVNGEYGVVGHSVMVHSGQDDLSTDPGGDAGDRVGCGVIMTN